jgi:hypothetical protein
MPAIIKEVTKKRSGLHHHHHHPTRLNAFLNPDNPSIVSRIETPDDADDDRVRDFDRPCALGTSSKPPLNLEALRLLFPAMPTLSSEVGCGASSARDEEREVCGDCDSFDEEMDVFEMVGTRVVVVVVVGIGCLCLIRKMGYLSFFEPLKDTEERKQKRIHEDLHCFKRLLGEWG